jgi:hypothetical protein
MKTLCHRKTDESLHVFTDETEICIKNKSLWFRYKEKEDFEIKGFDEENHIIYENVEIPKLWLNKCYRYNPKYGWKLIENYSYKEEKYEIYLRVFLKTCLILKHKNILSQEEYNNLIDFKEIESVLYHPITHYMPK